MEQITLLKLKKFSEDDLTKLLAKLTKVYFFFFPFYSLNVTSFFVLELRRECKGYGHFTTVAYFFPSAFNALW
jgi:hypothetical protein